MTILVRIKKLFFLSSYQVHQHNLRARQAGTTLIEVLVYILLLSFIIGGSLSAVYQILDGSRSMSTKTLAEQEADFVVRKIAWILNDSIVNSPNPLNPSVNTLSVNKAGFANPVVLDLLPNGQVQLKRGGAPALPISGTMVVISTLSFDFSRIGASSDAITASFYINDKKFQITRHVKF